MSLESGQRAEVIRPGRQAEASGATDGAASDGAGAAAATAQRGVTEAHEEAIKQALGGRMGMADAGLPSICFLVVYAITNQLNSALAGAVGVAALMTVIRLVRRESLQHALSGMFGVLICAAFAKYTGHASNYYALGILINLGSFLLLTITALVRWPLVGLMIGPITGEMTTWRTVPGRMRAFTNATWLFAALFAVKLAVQVPLWLTNHTVALGVVKLALGYPPYLACMYFAWQMIKAAPPPVMPEPVEDAEQ